MARSSPHPEATLTHGEWVTTRLPVLLETRMETRSWLRVLGHVERSHSSTRCWLRIRPTVVPVF